MIEITVDYRRAVRQLTDDGRKQIPYALAKAVNATVLDVQKAERANLRSKFELRRPAWADRSIKITRFAKKSDPTAIIGIHPPGDASRADILAKFETDTEKLPRSGTIAVPVSRIGVGRRKSTGIIPKRERPRAILDGSNKGVFLVRKKMGAVGEGIILQRLSFGRGKNRRSSVVALYYLVRRARIKNNLHFQLTALNAVDKTFVKHMTTEFDKAMKTAR